MLTGRGGGDRSELREIIQPRARRSAPRRKRLARISASGGGPLIGAPGVDLLAARDPASAYVGSASVSGAVMSGRQASPSLLHLARPADSSPSRARVAVAMGIPVAFAAPVAVR